MARKDEPRKPAHGGGGAGRKSARAGRAPTWTAILASSAQEQHELVGSGLPYAVVERLQEVLDLTLAELAELVSIQSRTLTRRRAAGRLQANESDRLLRAARLFDRATKLFAGSEEKARQWLRQDNRALGGRTPLDLARTEVGAREVETLIGRLEHGVFS